jgi:hypothetical protein
MPKRVRPRRKPKKLKKRKNYFKEKNLKKN